MSRKAEEQAAARLEDTGDLGQGPFHGGIVGQVMKNRIGEGKAEPGVLKSGVQDVADSERGLIAKPPGHRRRLCPRHLFVTEIDAGHGTRPALQQGEGEGAVTASEIDTVLAVEGGAEIVGIEAMATQIDEGLQLLVVMARPDFLPQFLMLLDDFLALEPGQGNLAVFDELRLQELAEHRRRVIDDRCRQLERVGAQIGIE